MTLGVYSAEEMRWEEEGDEDMLLIGVISTRWAYLSLNGYNTVRLLSLYDLAYWFEVSNMAH